MLCHDLQYANEDVACASLEKYGVTMQDLEESKNAFEATVTFPEGRPGDNAKDIFRFIVGPLLGRDHKDARLAKTMEAFEVGGIDTDNVPRFDQYYSAYHNRIIDVLELPVIQPKPGVTLSVSILGRKRAVRQLETISYM
jgi:hypothetical protein